MTSTIVSAESNVESTRSITSTQENVTVHLDITLFKASAPNVQLDKPTTSTPRLAALLLAKESTNTTLKPPKHVFVNHVMSVSEVFAPTATLDSTMTVTVTNVSVCLDTKKKEDSVYQNAPLVQPTSMESVSATMEVNLSMEFAKLSTTVLFTVTGTKLLTAVSAMPVIVSITENVAVINIAVLMVIKSMVSATAMKDTSGSLMLAAAAEPMRLITVWPVNAILDIIVMSMEIVSRATSSLTAMKMNAMIPYSRPASVLMAPSSSGEDAKRSLIALLTLIITPLAVFATLVMP